MPVMTILSLGFVFYVSPVFATEQMPFGLSPLMPSARFILQLGVLVFVAKIGGLLFDRWHKPKVLGELLAGILVGPHLLGGLPLPLFSKGLMSNAGAMLTPQEPMYGIITVSLVTLFFLIGLDTDVKQLRLSAKSGIVTGIVGFSGCFIISMTLLVWLSPAITSVSVTWLSPTALCISTIVSVTSVSIIARILTARQRLESPVGIIALTAAMADNVLGIFFFTVFSGMAISLSTGVESSGTLLLSTTLHTLLGFTLIALCGFPIARYMNTLALREKNYVSAFVVSVACLLIAGGMMGVLGLSVMSGAYMMGVAFSSTDVRHEIRERLDLINIMLVPACFTVLGMQVDLTLPASTQMATAAVLFVGGVMLAKLMGCATLSRLAHFTLTNCMQVGTLTLPRGELSLALLVTILGITALPSGIFLGVLLLIILSCVFSPFLIDHAFAWGNCEIRDGVKPIEPSNFSFQLPSSHAALLMINRAVTIFEDDGFYAHLLNRHHILYRLSREEQVIHLYENNGKVIFECSERERPLINAVMMELSSGVEQNLRELQRPLDNVLLRHNMQRPVSGAVTASATSMFRNRFAVEALKPRLLATTKQGAISELVSLLYEAGLVMDRDQAVTAVFERENSLSTGLEYGLAIPHARTDAVTRLICAVGLKQEGLDFDAADGQPTRIVVLILAPNHASTPQLQLIAQVCRLLDEKGRAALLACETAEDMFYVLTNASGSNATHVKAPSPLAASLQWQSISLDLAAPTQLEALTLLLALCSRSGVVSSAEEVRKALQTLPPRQPEMLGPDIAFFAIETPNVYHMVTALGINPQGVLGECGNRFRVCVLTLYPPSAARDCHQVRDILAHALMPEGLAALLAVKTGKNALALLLKHCK